MARAALPGGPRLWTAVAATAVASVVATACLTPVASPASSTVKVDDWQYEMPSAPVPASGSSAAVVPSVPGGPNRRPVPPATGPVPSAAPATPATGSTALGVAGSAAQASFARPMAAEAAASPARLGFATGGAKDIVNFRDNVRAGYLPLPTDIPYEGLFYDYYFDTGATDRCVTLFCPSYVASLSRDPFSGRPDLFVSVGLNSGLDAAQFSRKRLNLVIVLDISGSMGSPFGSYYYDRFGNRQEPTGEGPGRSKMEVAKASIVSLLGHLDDSDRLGVVLFNHDAYVAKPLRTMGDVDRDRLASHILAIEAQGSTNMDAGIRMATDLFEPFAEADGATTENRIIFLTDAMPNTGDTSPGGLTGLTRQNASRSIHTTIIGVGIDFNTELVSEITRIRGANYYAVHSSADFAKRLDTEFDFMVTPLVFDLALTLETRGYEIVKVYGSPDANETTGDILRIKTLFPSKVEEGRTRGGVVLLKLRKVSDQARLTLRASWEERSGQRKSETRAVDLEAAEGKPPSNTGIRKAILLSRYADVLLNWIIDTRRAAEPGAPRVESIHTPAVASVSVERGIPCPDIALGRWERQSVPLFVSPAYREVFRHFQAHFEAEAETLADATLGREAEVLERLAAGGVPVSEPQP